MHCNLKAAQRHISRSLAALIERPVRHQLTFSTFATIFGFGDPDVLSGTDILAIGGHQTCDIYLEHL